MVMEKKEMTIHAALAQVKILQKRLMKCMTGENAVYIGVTIGNSGKCNGTTVDKVSKQIQSNWDTFHSLLSNYKQIRFALMQKNAGIIDQEDLDSKGLLHMIELNGAHYSVSNLIEYQRIVNQFEEPFLALLTNLYNKASREVEKKNNEVDKRCDDIIKSMCGQDSKTKLTADTMSDVAQKYHENNDVRLVDPLNLSTKIQKMQNDLSQLKSDLDSLLSTENATTTISVNLQKLK